MYLFSQLAIENQEMADELNLLMYVLVWLIFLYKPQTFCMLTSDPSAFSY